MCLFGHLPAGGLRGPSWKLWEEPPILRGRCSDYLVHTLTPVFDAANVQGATPLSSEEVKIFLKWIASWLALCSYPHARAPSPFLPLSDALNLFTVSCHCFVRLQEKTLCRLQCLVLRCFQNLISIPVKVKKKTQQPNKINPNTSVHNPFNLSSYLFNTPL